ncbi:MAG: efflux RND transporter periplasmic adaptor subunit [Proteobacteria bacterium]|nr:efflux RND transporter periplasmic adaptor subunit [Pseudomonadota bacterium]
MSALPAGAPAPSIAPLKIDRTAAASAALHRRRNARRWGLLALVLIVAAAAWAMYPRTRSVQVASVVVAYPTAQYAQLTASGYVVAQRRAAVSSKATGRLTDLLVREGSAVRKGDIVARLDARDVQASIAAAEIGVRQSEADMRRAAAELRRAELTQADAGRDLQRTRDLSAQGFLSPQALDSSRARADEARAATDAAREALVQSRAAVAQARAQVTIQKVNEDYTVIRAPFDGVVLQKNANVGDIITPFSNAAGTQGAVLTMADMSTLEVETDVSESNVAKVKSGQPVEISLDAIPDMRFRGSVSSIVPTVDRAKATVVTKIRFDRLDPRILPEMSARVSFLSQVPTDADQKPTLAVNPKAVVERNGREVVFRVEHSKGEDKGSVVAEVAVTKGRMLGDVLEIHGTGLQGGDRLVLSADEHLSNGASVAVASGP